MRISKDSSRLVASQMLKARYDQQEKLLKELSSLTTSIVLKDMDKGLLKTFKSYPKYFRTRQSVEIFGKGFTGISIPLESKIPTASEWGSDRISFDDKTNEWLFDKYKKLTSYKNETENLRKELENTLFTLGTFKKIQEALPEAVPFLPKSSVTAVIPDLNKLRQRLKAA